MITEYVQINNSKGLHARPATNFLKLCIQFSSQITIAYNDQMASAKSITSLLKLGIPGGTSVLVQCDGNDEVMAMGQIKDFLSHQIED